MNSLSIESLKYRTLLMVVTIATAPFCALELLAVGEILRAVFQQIFTGNNPLEIFSVEYTANKIGMSKDICIACWPFFILGIFCVVIRLSRGIRFTGVGLGMILIISWIIPLLSILSGYTMPIWCILFFVLLCIGIAVAFGAFSE